jgi:hypothetical protein
MPPSFLGRWSPSADVAVKHNSAKYHSLHRSQNGENKKKKIVGGIQRKNLNVYNINKLWYTVWPITTKCIGGKQPKFGYGLQFI